MGQVLIIQNKIDGEPVNTIYYHWSAYTESSIAELDGFVNSLSHKYHNRFDAFLSTLTDNGKDLLKKFDKGSLTNEESVDLFNLMCYSVISGVSPSRKESLDYMSQFTSDTDRENVNRNFGMLAITEKDQNDHLIWSEGTIIVDWAFDAQGYPDFEKTVFDFSDLFDTCNAHDYNEWRIETLYDLALKPIKLLRKNPYPTSNIPLSAIKRLQEDLSNNPHIWKRNDNEIVTFIE